MTIPNITIWNLRNGQCPSGFVLVDRSTPYGNPFIMQEEAERDYVCNVFEDYANELLKLEPHWLDPLLDVHGLACWCFPKRCHAETLRRLIYQLQETMKQKVI